MMIDASTSIAVGDATIHLSAADDPARTGRFNDDAFLRRSVERAIDAMPSDAFSILMSHRPEGFDVASRHGVDLTLSGHYHGGIQVGWNGRAIIQGLMPNKHYWGHYRSGDAQLYTSGGIGHWFPFRLNCPPEAPVYVLRREEPRG
jgi:predicted MPP superfamily phosphohydrolase